jgi:hypothetical protein
VYYNSITFDKNFQALRQHFFCVGMPETAQNSFQFDNCSQYLFFNFQEGVKHQKD